MSAAVLVAQGALREVGLGHVAERVEANRGGMPTLRDDELHDRWRPQISKAFLLGHLAAGHDAWASRGVDRHFNWVDSIRCVECEAFSESLRLAEGEGKQE